MSAQITIGTRVKLKRKNATCLSIEIDDNIMCDVCKRNKDKQMGLCRQKNYLKHVKSHGCGLIIERIGNGLLVLKL